MSILPIVCAILIGLLATASESATTVPLYGIVEENVTWDGAGYDNPWEQVHVEATFTSPSGGKATIGGFYYSSNTWRVRFAPCELGNWIWQYEIGDGKKKESKSGSFTVVMSDYPGFVRSSPYNKYRWVFDNGKPFYPIGIGDSLWNYGDTKTRPTTIGLDGEFRGSEVGEQGWNVDLDTYFATYASAGFNLFRWSVDNCAYGLAERVDPRGSIYLEQQGIWGDELVTTLRKHGFRTYMAFFGFRPPFPNDSEDPEKMAAVKRYVKYVVDRYGAYVDFWELMNEYPNRPDTIDDDWYKQIAAYLRSIDPYKHPISTSWERPDIDGIDVSSPHWYERESEFDSDYITKRKFDEWKRVGKPVIVGEHGNRHANWDTRSALRMRIRAWTTFFVEGTLIFWNTSFAKDYRSEWAANIYLGPEERGYIRVLQSFNSGFDPRAAMAEVHASPRSIVRAYALSGPDAYAVYLHNYIDHTTPTTGAEVVIDPQFSGVASWIDPSTGKVLDTQNVVAGENTIHVPAFITDIALKIVRNAEP